VFAVDTAANWVHLLVGLIGVIMASMGSGKAFAKIFGVLFAAAAVIGFASGGDQLLSLMANNGADNVLYVILAVVFLYLGFKKSSSSMPAMGAGM
jgi:hypothetical protein